MTHRTNLNLNCFQRFTLLILLLVTSPMLAQQTHVVTNLNDAGAGSLRQLIDSSSHGDTITFSPSLLANASATIHLNSEIGFSHSLTIKGLFMGTDSLAISGMNTNRVFYVEASSNLIPTHVHLQDLIIKNGWQSSSDYNLHYTHGGAIYMAGLDKLSLENVIMRDNHAKVEASGGAMYLHDNDTVTLKRCQFVRNTTDTGSTSFNGSYGGAISQWYGVLIMDNCDFLANHSKRSGGAIRRNSGTLIIENSRFVANEAGLKLSYVDGGAVYTYNMDTVIIGNSNFTENKAKTSGGALRLYLSGSTVYDSYFRGNKAFVGGAISFDPHWMFGPKKIDVIECTLDSNVAQHGGAFDFAHWNGHVQKCYIHNNIATQGGGAIYADDAKIIVQNSTITDNKGDNGGSAFQLNNTKTAILNSTIVGTSNKDIAFLGPSGNDTLLLQSSILVAGGSNDIISHNSNHHIESLGHNIFSGNGSSYKVASDQVNVSPQVLALQPTGFYGGTTLCQPASPSSPALNAGNPNDYTPAQNGPVFGIRDCGAAEARVSSADTAELCGSYQWRGMILSTPGVYTDTIFNSNSIDSIAYLHLQKPDSLLRIVNGKLLAPPWAGSTTYQWFSCDTPFTPISGATDSLFQPTINGTYAVVMTRPNCIDTSDCISYNQVDLQEHRNRISFVSFYPNPSEGNIHLEVNEHIELNTLLIYDLQGRSIAQHKISGHVINLGDLPPGVFILEWHSTEGEVQRDRLIIE